MFTTQCFIRKNTPELRRKLEEMGWRPYLITYEDDPEAILLTWIYNNEDYLFMDGENTPTEAASAIEDGAIDCGTNEALFLALAALRNDSDRLQWFIDHENKWLLNQRDTIGEFVDRAAIAGYSCETLRKATPAELIEHFKNNE